MFSTVLSVFSVTHLVWALVGSVVTVSSTKVYAFVKAKSAAAEMAAKVEIAKAQPTVKTATADLKADVDKIVALAEAEAKKVI
jgi:hypothetical protein